MPTLKEKLAEQIPALREEVKNLVKQYGDKEVDKITVAQIFGGLRGVKALVCDTSSVPPERGLLIRGIPIAELADKLPEEIFYLLLTGELPDEESLKLLMADLRKRRKVPDYVWKVLKAMPKDSHPMCMLNTAILVMEKESVFKKQYDKGLKKEDYWIYTLEDALNLIARVPIIAAGIYRMKYNKGPRIPSDPKLDMGADFAKMLGIKDPKGEFVKLMRLYLVLHSDHESGNVSASTVQTVASALSDLYYALSAGLNGLAGPLHGLANQECLKFVLDLKKHFKGVPTDEQLRQFAWDWLNSGKVIPGYGHAVLRITDPRFDAFLKFGQTYCANDQIFQIVEKIFNVVPQVLMEQGKAKDPWPNVDAGSGALLWHYGMKEFDYYTVLFAVSRTLGVTAQTVIARAVGMPIVRPKSVTTQWIKNHVMQQG
ncbi:MAG: citrate (Si)-synthase [Ignavibacteria bacterium]|jgi:citrate synthase|nr:citrate (Si)-synthase [Ignavibacteria bacterium]MDH7527198.1 citrate (Si)-synthase [Ignavibacteria bacterium]